MFKSDLSITNLIRFYTNYLPPMKCPEKGSYIGYKKAVIWKKDKPVYVIITLEIPETAKRSSATTNNCRCSEAIIIPIESMGGTQKYNKATSAFDPSFIYKVGKTVKVVDFVNNRWFTCAPGIHHFMTQKEAEEYSF